MSKTPGVGYSPTIPLGGLTIVWHHEAGNDGTPAGDLYRKLDPSAPYKGGNDVVSMAARYAAPQRDVFSYNGPYIPRAGINTEIFSETSREAYDELTSRFAAGKLGSADAYTGEPTDQEVIDYLLSEWIPASRRPPAPAPPPAPPAPVSDTPPDTTPDQGPQPVDPQPQPVDPPPVIDPPPQPQPVNPPTPEPSTTAKPVIEWPLVPVVTLTTEAALSSSIATLSAAGGWTFMGKGRHAQLKHTQDALEDADREIGHLNKELDDLHASLEGIKFKLGY